MSWQNFSIRRRINIVLSSILVITALLAVCMQAWMTSQQQLRDMKQHILPNQLRGLAFEIMNDLQPAITGSEFLAHDSLLQQWLSEGSDLSQTADVMTPLATAKHRLGADTAFAVMEASEGTYIFTYQGALQHTLLDDYPFKAFYANFIATDNDFELNMNPDPNTGEYVMFINYRHEHALLDGRPKMVAGVGFNVTSLVKKVESFRIGEAGKASIASVRGIVEVAPSDATLASRQLPSTVRSAITAGRSQLAINEVLIDGESYLIGSFWLDGLDRFVVLELPTAQIMAPIFQQLLKTLTLTAVFILIMVFLSHRIVTALTRPIQRLSQEIDLIAKGLDLRATITVKDGADIAYLATSINGLIARIKHALTSVNSTIHDSHSAFSELQQRSNQVVKATQQQHASLTVISDAVQNITIRTSEVSAFANQAGSLSSEGDRALSGALQGMKTSLKNIEQLETNMLSSQGSLDELNAQIENILRVLDVISSISEQTNLLALNAAIEAARAGEHGRGFAVVADEVRSLSQRTSDSTNEIQDMINNLRAASGQVNQQLQTVNENGKHSLLAHNQAMEDVTTLDAVLHNLFDMIVQIAKGAEEQSQAIQEINHNIEQLADNGAKNKRVLNDGGHAINQLDQKMNQLEAEIQVFQGV